MAPSHEYSTVASTGAPTGVDDTTGQIVTPGVLANAAEEAAIAKTVAGADDTKSYFPTPLPFPFSTVQAATFVPQMDRTFDHTTTKVVARVLSAATTNQHLLGTFDLPQNDLIDCLERIPADVRQSLINTGSLVRWMIPRIAFRCGVPRAWHSSDRVQAFKEALGNLDCCDIIGKRLDTLVGSRLPESGADIYFLMVGFIYTGEEGDMRGTDGLQTLGNLIYGGCVELCNEFLSGPCANNYQSQSSDSRRSDVWRHVMNLLSGTPSQFFFKRQQLPPVDDAADPGRMVVSYRRFDPYPAIQRRVGHY